jgi:hypothetical protein
LLLAAALLVHSAAIALPLPAAENPLEHHVLQHSKGTIYAYHAGLRFSMQITDLGGQVGDAFPWLLR